MEILQRLHAVHLFAQRAAREVASERHFAQVLVRERTLQHFSDVVMNQRRQERVPDAHGLTSTEPEEESSSKRVHTAEN